MVKHVVMWNLKDNAAGNDKKTNAAEIKRRLEALVGKIDGMYSLVVGENLSEKGFDLCLVGEYRDLEAVKYYRSHPLHKEVQTFVHEVITDRVSCDFEA